MRTTWKRGEQSELARRSGISRQYLCHLLHRRKRVTPERATTLEAEARGMGLRLTRMDLMYPGESSNPLFKTTL